MADHASKTNPDTDFEVTRDGTAIPAHGEEGLPLPKNIADKVAKEPDPMEADEPESNRSIGGGDRSREPEPRGK